MNLRKAKLVVIQLTGGNDGLNTVIPFRNDNYYRFRPTIAIPSNEIIPLDDELGLNPKMEKFSRLSLKRVTFPSSTLLVIPIKVGLTLPLWTFGTPVQMLISKVKPDG